MNSNPEKSWTYREIDCILYELDTPNNTRWIGYAKFGDKWTEVVDISFGGRSNAVSRVESEVDNAIQRALNNDDWNIINHQISSSNSTRDYNVLDPTNEYNTINPFDDDDEDGLGAQLLG